MAEPEGALGSGDHDQDFEPSADMLVHDFDDEATLDDEEDMSNDSADNTELDDLARENDIPIEELMAMYGHPPPRQDSHDSTSEEEILHNHDLTLDKEEVARDILKDDDDSETSLDELMENVQPSRTVHLLQGPMNHLHTNDDDDEDYLPSISDECWKKNIQIGEDYQVELPEFGAHDEPPTPCSVEERLLWDPNVLSESEVVNYLGEISSCSGVVSNGAVVHDDEQALYTLIQSDFNAEEALRRRKLQAIPSSSDPISLWSEEECQNFESGLRVYGKNFFAIHHNKVRTRSVGELVQFYYFWKKTERREAFCSRGKLEKKRLPVTPGTTDYTDRFIDRAESPQQPECMCSVTSSTDAVISPYIDSNNGEAVIPLATLAAAAITATIAPSTEQGSLNKRSYHSDGDVLNSEAKRLRVDTVTYNGVSPTEASTN